MKSFYLIILIFILFTGCSRKFSYQFPSDTENLKNMTLNQFFNNIQAVDPVAEGVAEIIATNDLGINKSKLFCEAKDGKFIDIDIVTTSLINQKIDLMSIDKSKICKIDNNPYFLIFSGRGKIYSAYIDISQKSLDKYHELRKKEEDNLIEHEKQRLKAKQDEESEKIRKELQLTQKINYLKSRKGSIEAIIYDNFEYSFNPEKCAKSCDEMSLNNCGYTNLQNALEDKWQFISFSGEVKQNVNSNCICKGSKIILKK